MGVGRSGVALVSLCHHLSLSQGQKDEVGRAGEVLECCCGPLGLVPPRKGLSLVRGEAWRGFVLTPQLGSVGRQRFLFGVFPSKVSMGCFFCDAAPGDGAGWLQEPICAPRSIRIGKERKGAVYPKKFPPFFRLVA